MNLFGLSSKLKQLILPFAKQYIRSQALFKANYFSNLLLISHTCTGG